MNASLSSGAAIPTLAVALELAGGDPMVARRLLEMIVDTNRSMLVLLRDSVEAGSLDIVASAAHRLSGSARMLECAGLVVLINELEAAARSRQQGLVSMLLPRVAIAVAQFDASIKVALGSASQA